MGDSWTNSAGDALACYKWTVEDPKFLVYISHGYAEHANRYSSVVGPMNELGGSVYSHDHSHHGESGPHPKKSQKRYDIDSFDDAAKDLADRIKIVRTENPDLPLILYGHSMGGLLALMTVISDQEIIQGLILEAPCLKIHPSTGAWWQILGAKLLGGIAPGLKVGKVDKKLITRNEAVVQSIIDDENCADNGGASAGFAVKMLKAQDEVMRLLDTITCKTLVASGTDDFLTCKSGSDFAAGKMKDCTYKVYDGSYHQIHAELDETVTHFITDLKDWIKTNFELS